jgi:hypothetical protein
MLYWMETTILAFWTLMRLSGSRARTAGPSRSTAAEAGHAVGLVGFFALHSGAFILDTCSSLVVFSTNGSRPFTARELLPRAVRRQASGSRCCSCSSLRRLVFRQPEAARPIRDGEGDPVGAIVAVLYSASSSCRCDHLRRMVSGFTGSLAPLLIVIGPKTWSISGMASRIPVIKTSTSQRSLDRT